MGQNKYHWTEIKLPKITSSNYPPIMFEKDNKLNIICITNDEIHCLVSKNYGLNWNLENKISLNKRAIHLIKYFCNNLSNNINSKINHCYGSTDDDNVHFYFDENLDKALINDKVSSSTLDNEYQGKDNLVNQEEEINMKNTKEEQLMDLKNLLLENQNQLMNTFNHAKENSTSLKEVVATINDIKKDIEFIKEKITNIEKNQNTKKRFFNI